MPSSSAADHQRSDYLLPPLAPVLSGGTIMCVVGLIVSAPLLLVYAALSHAFAVVMWLSQWWLAMSDMRAEVAPEDGVALITGASSGIGEKLAIQLAERGFALVLVARRKERLEDLALRLRELHDVAVTVVEADLSSEGEVHRVFELVTLQRGLHVAILVNNAGAGLGGRFVDHDLATVRARLALNTRAPIELMHLCLNSMRARGKGHVLNISSTASIWPVPFEALYSGTKHLLTATSRAVHFELAGSGVSVTSACPGATTTEFAEAAGEQDALIFKIPFMVQSAEACARQCLDAMFARRPYAIVGQLGGLVYYLGAVVQTMVPERVMLSATSLFFGVKF